MPLEIRELHIRITVNQPNSEDEKPSAGTKPALDKELLVQQCIEQILEMIKNKNER